MTTMVQPWFNHVVEPWFIYHGIRLYHVKLTMVVPWQLYHDSTTMVEPWYDYHDTNIV